MNDMIPLGCGIYLCLFAGIIFLLIKLVQEGRDKSANERAFYYLAGAFLFIFLLAMIIVPAYFIYLGLHEYGEIMRNWR